MKMNAPKRKIFDAVDVLVGDSQEKVTGGTVHDIQMIPLAQIKPFHSEVTLRMTAESGSSRSRIHRLPPR